MSHDLTPPPPPPRITVRLRSLSILRFPDIKPGMCLRDAGTDEIAERIIALHAQGVRALPLNFAGWLAIGYAEAE